MQHYDFFNFSSSHMHKHTLNTSVHVYHYLNRLSFTVIIITLNSHVKNVMLIEGLCKPIGLDQVVSYILLHDCMMYVTVLNVSFHNEVHR